MTRTFALTTVTLEDQILPVIGSINPRAKRLRLRFQRDYQSLMVTLPSKTLQKQAVEFVNLSLPWIQKHFRPSQARMILAPDQTIVVLGSALSLRHRAHPRCSVWEEGHTLTIHSPKETFEAMLIQYLKEKLRLFLIERIRHYCEALSVTYNRLYIRDSRSNWGCCSSKKNLSFSWRLIFAPVEVIEYVLAHGR